MNREEWYRLSEEKFNSLFSGSPVKRAGYKGFMRNLQFLMEAPPDLPKGGVNISK